MSDLEICEKLLDIWTQITLRQFQLMSGLKQLTFSV